MCYTSYVKKGKGSKMENIYIFGHQKPDTDSVCASISLSYLKNQLGLKTIPKVLGHVNNEAKYALDYFGIKEPGFLNDVKIQIKNMHYNEKVIVDDTSSIFDAYKLMQSEGVTGVAVVDQNKKLKGLATLKEIAKTIINGDKEKLNTNLENINKALNGEIVLKFDYEIQGRILVGSYQSSTFAQEIDLKNDDILIVGDRFKVLDYAINSKIKLLILVGNYTLDGELLERAKENKINVIKTELDTYHTISNISLANYIDTVIENKSSISVLDTDYRSHLLDVIDKYGHTNYAVVNKNNKCLGVISINDVNQYEKLKVMLVDHNGFSQSVEGIEEAIIEEVVDHHNLLNIGTPDPINFRSMPVGCTCTIIYHMFLENHIDIPKEIAGIMLSAIISDTLLLRSVTTTAMDREAVEALAKIANVNVAEYGHNMIKEGFSIKGKKIEELLEEDIKTFRVGEKMVGINQIFTMDYEDIVSDLDNFIDKIDDLASGKFDIVITLITDIEKNGSYVFFDRKSEEIVKSIFNDEEFSEGTYIQDLLSRKKQVVPNVMEVLEKRA